MRRCSVLLVLLVCLVMALPAMAKKSRPAPKAKPAKPAPVKIDLPSAVDQNSLGFGSGVADIERVLGKPDRVAKVTAGSTWFYGLSKLTIANGKLVGWCKYNKPLLVNIGAAEPDAPAVKVGATAKQLVASQGTPDSVLIYRDQQTWFYGAKVFTLRKGKVIPTPVAPPSAAPAPKTPANDNFSKPTPSGGRQKCYCPI